MNRLDRLIEQFDDGEGVINHRELTELVGLLLVERPTMQYVVRKINVAATGLAEAMDRLGEKHVT